MLLDSQNLFSDNQKITTGTIYSTNTVKFGTGDISYLPLLIQVTEDFSGLEKLSVAIITSADKEFTASTSLAECSLGLPELKAGKCFPVSYMPKGNLGYVKLKYDVTGSATAGAITAGIISANDVEFIK